jgi:Type II CAAX prenyl endopeptidase Rce1-like
MEASMPAIRRENAGALSAESRPVKPWITASEVLAVYAATLLYIWRWQEDHPFLWIPMLAAVLFSQWFHHDTLEAMGLTGREFRPCARASLPFLAVVIIAGSFCAVMGHDSTARVLSPRAGLTFAGYLVWCSLQQYLTQSYFHRRLMKLIRSPHLRSVAVGLLFAGVHIPNPVLMVATFTGGVVFAEIFTRHPNIWPLAFVQAVAGFLIGALSPPWLIHGMRVGPGYFLFHLH